MPSPRRSGSKPTAKWGTRSGARSKQLAAEDMSVKQLV
jgi:hypothetical protein